jgi:rifampicin phosphotransferase
LAYVVNLERIDRNDIVDVGGKAAQLGELSRIDDIRLPGGFCVTTDAVGRAVAEVPSIADRVDGLSRVEPDDHEAIHAQSAQVGPGRPRRRATTQARPPSLPRCAARA